MLNSAAGLNFNPIRSCGQAVGGAGQAGGNPLEGGGGVCVSPAHTPAISRPSPTLEPGAWAAKLCRPHPSALGICQGADSGGPLHPASWGCRTHLTLATTDTSWAMTTRQGLRIAQSSPPRAVQDTPPVLRSAPLGTMGQEPPAQLLLPWGQKPHALTCVPSLRLPPPPGPQT